MDFQCLAPLAMDFEKVYCEEQNGVISNCTDSQPLHYFRKGVKIWSVHNHKGQLDWYVRHERGIFYHRQVSGTNRPNHENFDWNQCKSGCGGCMAIVAYLVLMSIMSVWLATKVLQWIE